MHTSKFCRLDPLKLMRAIFGLSVNYSCNFIRQRKDILHDRLSIIKIYFCVEKSLKKGLTLGADSVELEHKLCQYCILPPGKDVM